MAEEKNELEKITAGAKKFAGVATAVVGALFAISNIFKKDEKKSKQWAKKAQYSTSMVTHKPANQF